MPDLGGILVGGRGTRMGGVAKGLLATSSGETLIARWQRLFSAIGVRCILVGEHASYRDSGIECIADEPPHIGPLGGLVSLLSAAGESRAIAVACDMPFVSIELLSKLVAFPSAAPIIAPRRGGRWEPLFARYDAPRVIAAARKRIAAGEHSLQGLLTDVGAEPLPLDASEWEQMRDWDRPEDRLI
jgi:molybdopterin-guanine dinucleotide biosynthesis protein A